jgi:hypothetical protein
VHGAGRSTLVSNTDQRYAQEMDGAPSRLKRFRDWLLRLYCQALILFALYVFSIGPMYWEIYEAYELDGSPVVAAAYYPVVWTCERNEYVSDWVDWYVGLWIL